MRVRACAEVQRGAAARAIAEPRALRQAGKKSPIDSGPFTGALLGP